MPWTTPITDGSKTILNKAASIPNPQLNPIELINKVLGGIHSIGDVQSADEGEATHAQKRRFQNQVPWGGFEMFVFSSLRRKRRI